MGVENPGTNHGGTMSVYDGLMSTLHAGGRDVDYIRIADLPGIDHLPYSLKVLVENLIRSRDGENITDDHIQTLLDWDPQAQPSHEIQFTPSRVVMQDFTGVPCIVDLATMRDAVHDLGGDPDRSFITPLPVDRDDDPLGAVFHGGCDSPERE